MTVTRIHSGSEFETQVGYSRAVVAGGWVHVSGTVGEGDTVEEQCAAALQKIGAALSTAGCCFADVVRVTYMLPRATDLKACWPLLRASFGDTPPGGDHGGVRPY